MTKYTFLLTPVCYACMLLLISKPSRQMMTHACII